ncbi:MAG: efflux RND transporter periplasmic adaptor subunit [Gemmatimonadales bacterium]|jgi:RND family efflux transporter MFP subunit
MNESMTRKPERGAFWLCLALTGLVVTGGCAREIGSDTPEEAPEESRASVALALPEKDGDRTFQANLYSERDADLFNRLMVQENVGVGTPITSIRVEVGDRVNAGQLLATLEDSDARIDVAGAEPEAEIAASNLRRVQELRKTGAVSEAELEDAVYASRTAEAAVEKARLNLSRTEIRAPFAGVVSRRYVRVGDVVDDKTPLFRVTALAPLRARLLVPESEVAAFGTGASVRITAADGTTGTARVIIVGPTIDPGSGTREVIVELSRVGDFRPGASVSAELITSSADEGMSTPDQGSATGATSTQASAMP